MSKKQIILSGAQPTAGSLHLGNYAGMVKPMVDLQNGNDDKDLYLFIADLHAITNPDVDLRETDKKALICTYVASGIDLNKTKLFYQSDVHAHAELGWVLICQSTYGELSRMTQFKDKSSKFDKANGTSSIPAGLLVYPPLMAADILLYDTNLVPVGIDQKQHVELTRNLAERFNNKFGQTFVLPEAYITKETAKIYDLQDPTKKMSKSAASKNGVIFLNDSIEDVQRKIKVALTDSLNQIKYDPQNQPAVSNLIVIYSFISNMSIHEIEKKYENIANYGEFKKDLSEIVVLWISKFQEKYAMAEKNFDELYDVVKQTAKFCNELTQKKIDDVYKKIGIRK